jgi:cyanophycin synthetase
MSELMMIVGSSNLSAFAQPVWLADMLARSGWFRAQRLAHGRINSGVRRMWRARVAFYQAMWRNACAATATAIIVRPNGDIEMSRGNRHLKAHDNETYVDDPVAIKRALDKRLVYRLLTEADIPVPRHVVVRPPEYDRALVHLQSSRGPVVVKPAAGTGGGSGVTTNVVTPRELRSAMAWSRTYGKDILIEDQIEGDCYRILMMDGKHIETILRHPPTVIGDGHSTIRQLLRKENQRRVDEGDARSQVLIAEDRDLINTLARQGLGMRSRPAKDALVRVKQMVNENALQENTRANGILCKEIIASARRAAEVVGIRLAGVDVICRDPSVPLSASGGVILEVNAPPNLYYHDLEARNASVAKAILDAYFGHWQTVDLTSSTGSSFRKRWRYKELETNPIRR